MKSHTSTVDRARAYLAHRRALGFALRTQGFELLRFARFADRVRHRGPVTPQIVMRWLEETSNNVPSGVAAVRGFAKYLAVHDGCSQAPAPQLVPRHHRRKRPHIYTAEQVQQLLEATSRLPLQHDLDPLTYQTLFGLLASTGLRISEATSLCWRHVDLHHGTLHIERTKFNKSRSIPLHPTVVQALQKYATARNQRRKMQPEQPFFINSYGAALSTESAQDRFRQVCNGLGWKQGNGETRRPRLHDLRHSFACHRIQQWYHDGLNIHQHINALSAYMGHADVISTYWYLTATPELLETAGDRFERFAAIAERRPS